MGSRFDRIEVDDSNGVTILDMGHVEIWDGADLALLRDSLTDVIVNGGAQSIGVNMRYVKYIPSGFFGMLFDWNDKGIDIRLYLPQPNVRNMLWFRRFFEEETEGSFRLRPDLERALEEPMEEFVEDLEAISFREEPY